MFLLDKRNKNTRALLSYLPKLIWKMNIHSHSVAVLFCIRDSIPVQNKCSMFKGLNILSLSRLY